MRPKILQIVPSLPPRIDAIRDYAERLAASGIDSDLLGCEGGDRDVARAWWNGDVRRLPRRAARELERSIAGAAPDTVLLHYGGYGYARRGAPFWLVEGLRRWRRSDPRRRLVVMFHELWASGPPWRSSFWMEPLQRLAVRRVAGLADRLLTSTTLYADRLGRAAPPCTPIAVLPVLSNVGEPSILPSFRTRPPWAVVFGQGGHRRRVHESLDRFRPLLGALGVERVVDIGSPLPEAVTADPALPVTAHGFLPPDGVSGILRQARFGLLCYPLDHLAKSGIFAAYAAHGVVPVVDGERSGAPDGLLHGRNLLRLGERIPPGGAEQADAWSAAIRAWYRGHDLAATSRAYRHALLPAETPR